MPESIRPPYDSRETLAFYLTAALFLVVLPLLNVLPSRENTM